MSGPRPAWLLLRVSGCRAPGRHWPRPHNWRSGWRMPGRVTRCMPNSICPACWATGRTGRPCAPLVLDSAAADRQTYLLRPDLGRRLSARFRAPPLRFLANSLSFWPTGCRRAPCGPGGAGLSGAFPFIGAGGWAIAPLVIVRQGRVAMVRDRPRNARYLRAGLIGERPGLSAPDSLGAYLTVAPRSGNHRRGPQLHFQYSSRRDHAAGSGAANCPAADTHAPAGVFGSGVERGAEAIAITGEPT